MPIGKASIAALRTCVPALSEWAAIWRSHPRPEVGRASSSRSRSTSSTAGRRRTQTRLRRAVDRLISLTMNVPSTNPEGSDPVSARPLRLLVVDDHEVVRQGLVALLDRREGFEVVAEAGTVAEAIEQARRFRPDIVVMDVRLPDGSG